MALEESDCTLLKMLKLVEAERLRKISVRDTKTTGEMGRISTYMRQKSDDTAGPQGGDAKKTKSKKCGRWATSGRGRIHKVPPIQVHWEEKVTADIFCDDELGVLERVTENTPVTWCHRMVVCRKHNGDPRMTVDLKKLNDASVRQTHPTQPPLKQSMNVPPGQRKMILDAWNGYHSVDITEEDHHLTTFLTDLARFRYKSAPQGYLASGDVYMDMYDRITNHHGL